MSATGYKNQPLVIDLATNINSGSDGNWSISSGIATHNNNLGSYIDLVVPITIGESYRLTYVVSSYGLCNFNSVLGDSNGAIHFATGTFIDTFTYTSGLPKLRFYSTGTVSINHYKLEHLATTIVDSPIDITNTTKVQNKSWTLSYDPILQQWVSFHSYLPNNYLLHPTDLLAKRNDSQIKLLNSGDYGKFFDNDIKPWIVETVFNDNKLNTKVFDNITVNLESHTLAKVPTNKFFDSLVLYNEFQSTGNITLDTTNLTKKEKNWMINKFTDLTNNSSNSLFTEDWSSIGQYYPIDKVVNNAKIDNTKPWYLRARLRDKYLIVRFTENNLDNNRLNLKFILTIFRHSER